MGKEVLVKDGFAEKGVHVVYFLQVEGGHTKIGKSNNMKVRINNLRTQGNLNIERVSFIDGFYSTAEIQIHKHLSEFRVQGEWFRIKISDIENEIQKISLSDFAYIKHTPNYKGMDKFVWGVVTKSLYIDDVNFLYDNFSFKKEYFNCKTLEEFCHSCADNVGDIGTDEYEEEYKYWYEELFQKSQTINMNKLSLVEYINARYKNTVCVEVFNAFYSLCVKHFDEFINGELSEEQYKQKIFLSIYDNIYELTYFERKAIL